MQTASHRRQSVLLTLVFYWACALATHASGLWQPMHADYSCWIRVARDWQGGSALYRDTYDNKTPWVYRWVRAIDSPRPEVSCYLAESLLAAAGATLFQRALRTSFPRVAGLVPLLLVVWSGTNQTFYGAQTTEAVALWFNVAAVSAWAMAARKGSGAWACAAGACLFVTAAFRPPALVTALAWLPFAWWLLRERSQSVAWRTLGAALLGLIAMLGLFCLDVAASGQSDDFLKVLAHNANYASPSDLSRSLSLAEGAITIARLLLDNAVAMVLVCTSAIVCWRSIRPMPRRQRYWCVTALLWTLAAVAAAMPGGRHYAHYYHFLWAPLSVLATLWLAGVWRDRLAKRMQSRIVLGVAVGSIALALLHEAYAAARNVRDYRAGTHPRVLVERAADWLASASDGKTPVVVHAWGDRAELYWRLPRPSPSFHIPHVLPPELFNQWASATLAEPPLFIVWDGTPWEPIDGAADATLVARWTTLVREQYHEVARFGTLSTLQRNGHP